ncbi:MAG: hypothetical protein M3Q69_03905, partial [Acidobacteriota bacterium]|nr:hypothetical protein [Acidobacteriota bacterium]
MKRFNVTLLSLLLLLPAAVHAQSAASERLLIPIAITVPVPGAFGSLWTTELVARNSGATPVHLRNIAPVCPPIGASCGSEADIGAEQSAVVMPEATDRRAAIIEATPGERLAFSLRVRDLSRQLETWGTEIPVVRERDLRSGTITLVNVPVSSAFRNTLRVYDIDALTDAEVRIRLYRIVPVQVGFYTVPDRDMLLGEARLRLIAPLESQRGRSPAYLEIGDLTAIAPLGS